MVQIPINYEPSIWRETIPAFFLTAEVFPSFPFILARRGLHSLLHPEALLWLVSSGVARGQLFGKDGPLMKGFASIRGKRPTKYQTHRFVEVWKCSVHFSLVLPVLLSITYWHDVASQKLQGIRSRDEQVHFLSQARPLWGFHDRFQIKVGNLLWKEWISDASMTQHTLYAWVYRNMPRNSRLKKPWLGDLCRYLHTTLYHMYN